MSRISSGQLTFLTATFGIATALLTLWMLFLFPFQAELASGWNSPLIAFEFAQTEADVAFLAGQSETAIQNRAKMDAGHRVDMIFPIAYAGVFALLALQAVKSGKRWMWLAVIVSVLIVPFDYNENRVLFGITDVLSRAESPIPLLAELHVATYLKWGAIACVSALLSVAYAIEKHWWRALSCGVAALSILIAYVSGSASWAAEGASLCFVVLFIVLILQAWREAFLLSRVSTHIQA